MRLCPHGWSVGLSDEARYGARVPEVNEIGQCANDKLNIDAISALKINVDNLDELLRTVDEDNLAALQRVRFIYNVDDDVLDEVELGAVRFLQTLQLNGWTERRSCCNEQSPRPE